MFGVILMKPVAGSCDTDGDHDIWKSPRSDKPFTVPVKIKSWRMANKIMKDAGLPKAY